MKNIFCLLLFMGVALGIKAQSTTVFIYDLRTEDPIPNVNIYDNETNKGSISNTNGKIRIRESLLKQDSLRLSHVSYGNRTFSTEELLSKDTIYLRPSKFNLHEVVISDFDLIKKVKKVLNHYEELYPIKPMSYYGTYKESAKVNDTLARLSQVQLHLWDKSYSYDFIRITGKITK